MSAMVQLTERAQALQAQAAAIRAQAKASADELERQARKLLALAAKITPEVELLMDELLAALGRKSA
jgi:hypothetical protein